MPVAVAIAVAVAVAAAVAKTYYGGIWDHWDRRKRTRVFRDFRACRVKDFQDFGSKLKSRSRETPATTAGVLFTGMYVKQQNNIIIFMHTLW